MKVKCINIYNEHTKEYQDFSPWITIGKEYTVLEISISPEKRVLYRLVGDNINKSPALYDSKQFEIISGKLASNWKISQYETGGLNVSPQAWKESGFWEDCYDGDPAALEIYKHEARIIMEEENALNIKR